MPNWIEGVLKIRGDQEHLLKFLNEGMDEVEGGSPSDWKIERFDEDEDYVYASVRIAHLVGTNRGFIVDSGDEVYPSKDGIYTMCLDAKFAWDIDVEGMIELSKKTGVDFKFYGFEMGMEFNREIEILQGQLTEDRTILFDDYKWECIDPRRGG